MCDPWEQKAFNELMGQIPERQCDQCLQDCTQNIFETRVTAAVFKKCDEKNLGASILCNLDELDINPPIWLQDATDEFKAQTEETPDFLLRDAENGTRSSNIRPYIPDPKKKPNLAFQEKLKQHPTYDAFKDDIAMVNFYFERDD